MENAIVFGKYDHLMGIWTEQSPKDPQTKSCERAVILITAGMLHSTGPYRLYRELAERLAQKSIGTMRFDLSGIGESFGVGVAGESTERAVDEIQQAMDWIESKHGIHNFVLMGLCSGADDAFRAAQADRRVCGLVSMDGLGYRTPRYYLHRLTKHYAKRLVRFDKWLTLIHRMFDNDVESNTPSSLQAGADIREYPPRDEAAQMLESLANRGTRMHFIYTGGVAEYYNYTNQFNDMFPDLRGRREITTKYFETMDHVAYMCEDRDTLASHITDICSSTCMHQNLR